MVARLTRLLLLRAMVALLNSAAGYPVVTLDTAEGADGDELEGEARGDQERGRAVTILAGGRLGVVARLIYTSPYDPGEQFIFPEAILSDPEGPTRFEGSIALNAIYETLLYPH